MGLFKSAFNKIRDGLSRTRDGFSESLGFLTGQTLSDELLKRLEATLIQSDVGVKAARNLIDDIRAAWERSEIDTGDEARVWLKQLLVDYFPEADRRLHLADTAPTVILVAGINGAGKTTSIAKIAKALKDEGKSVRLAACDTFRAAAVEQLTIWSQRLGVEITAGKQGGDPAAVAFDACSAAVARGDDVVVVDTAGRLQTQKNLMNQLEKIRRVIQKVIPQAPHEVILVLDATIGQNAISQARQFTEAVEVSGLFLAKLDGTAKGGVVVAIREELNIPVKFIGVGETPDDVEPFEPDKFIEALFAD